MLAIKKTLLSSTSICEEDNVALLNANLCSNQETKPDALASYFNEAKESIHEGKNKQVLSMLTDLSLCLSRVRPMTDRFSKVFEHEYGQENRTVLEEQ